VRKIVIPEAMLRRAVEGPVMGRALTLTVAVDWPELQWTEEEMVANAVAAAWGEPMPFPPRFLISVEVPYVQIDNRSRERED